MSRAKPDPKLRLWLKFRRMHDELLASLLYQSAPEVRRETGPQQRPTCSPPQNVPDVVSLMGGGERDG